MTRRAIGTITLALLFGLGLTTACAPTSRASPATLSPSASPAPTIEVSPTPPPPPTPTVPAPTPTLAATATPTVSASDISIEVSSGGTTLATLVSGQSATVPVENGIISVLAHYPLPLGSSDTNGFHPYPITVKVEPADWQVEMGNFARNDTLSFRLRGTSNGPHTVNVSIAQPGIPSVAFTLDAVPGGAPSEASAGGQQTVTLGDDGKTITLKVGDRFLLALGSGYDWTVNVANQAIISRVVNITVVSGAQGVYEAKAAGSTTLTAVGNPVCRKVQPPCGLPSRTFKVQITVR